MKKYWCILFFAFFWHFNLYPQSSNTDESSVWISQLQIEAGFTYPDGKIRESVSIRQNISSFYVDQYSNGSVYADTYGNFFSLKWEYLNQNLNLGFSTGLRYNSFQTEIYGSSSYGADFIYLRYSILDSNTKFARVKSITEDISFISVPVEVSFSPFEYKNFRLLASGGIEFSLVNLSRGTSIEFQEESMASFENDILDKIRASSTNFYSSIYATFGLRYGKKDKPKYGFEIFLPSFFLSQDNFELTEVTNFTGFRMSVRFPLIKKH
jgi:hypothetical protein